MNVTHKAFQDLSNRFELSKVDGSSIEQVMTDFAVIVLSNMRPCEVDAALYMSMGHEGVAQLLATRVGDSNDSDRQTTDQVQGGHNRVARQQ